MWAIGVKHYAFHDIDIAPEGATLGETEKIFHEVTVSRQAKQPDRLLGILGSIKRRNILDIF